jgi:hypothetical protein
MATLKELFDGEFGYMLKVDQEVSSSNGAITSKAIERLYFGFDPYTSFLAFYLAEEFATSEFLHSLVAQYEDSIARLKGGAETSMGHPAVYEAPGLSSGKLPFTGRVIIYVAAVLDDATKQSLVASGTANGLRIQIRDRSYVEFLSSTEKPLGFISHDSRDKDSFVRPLAERLRSVLCPVWYDEFSIQPGMSLRESIDAGLKESKRCVIVLSQNFLTNPGWGKAEFNAAVNKHIGSGGNVIIPIWHGVTQEEVAEYSPLIVDLWAINSRIGDDEVFRLLHRALLAD